MTEVDLSTLSGPELRGLLNTARSRGQAAQSYEILQEMAARRDPGVLPPKRRVVSLDLGDPMAREEEAPLPAIEAEPPLYLSMEPRTGPRPDPRSVWDAAPEGPPKLEGLPKPKRPSLRTAVGFVAGAAVGLAGGLAVAALDLGQQAPAPPVAPPADFVQVATLTPPPQPVIAPPAEPPVVAPEAAPAETPVEPESAAPEPEPEVVVAEAAETPDPACAGKHTPADRTICADPRLKDLQHELRLAYGQALKAHEDRDLLRERQLAWADARDEVSDPEQLARMYEQRIRKLNAAARAAKNADTTPKRRATRG